MNKFKKYLIAALLTVGAVVGVTSCSDDIFEHHKDNVSMGEVIITLSGSDHVSNIDVTLRNTSTNSIFSQATDAQGRATFSVTPGIYEATVLSGFAAEALYRLSRARCPCSRTDTVAACR